MTENGYGVVNPVITSYIFLAVLAEEDGIW